LLFGVFFVLKISREKKYKTGSFSLSTLVDVLCTRTPSLNVSVVVLQKMFYLEDFFFLFSVCSLVYEVIPSVEGKTNITGFIEWA